MPSSLGDADIRKRLKGLPGWKKKGRFIVKVFEFATFPQAIAFVDQVAKVAEKEEHHPDIGVRYTAVTLSLQTHSEGGVTGWDFELAVAIEKALGAKRSSNPPGPKRRRIVKRQQGWWAPRGQQPAA